MPEHYICSEEKRLARLELELPRLEETVESVRTDVQAVRAMLVGPAPAEDDGLREEVRAIATAITALRAENRFLKWGIGLLLAAKTPDLITSLSVLLQKGFHP